MRISRTWSAMLAALGVAILLALVPQLAKSQTSDPAAGTVTVHAETGGLAIVFAHNGASRRLAFVDYAQAPLVLADFVALAPGGQHLAYVTMDNPFSRANATLWVVATDAATPTARPIHSVPAGFWPLTPLWSPDGTHLAVVQQEPGSGDLALWTIPAEGGPARRAYTYDNLAAALGMQLPGTVTWSADGSQLWIDDQSGVEPVLIGVDVQSGAVSRVPTVRRPPLPRSATQLPCAVPLLHQNVYTATMQSCNETIAASGCALTSVTMVFQYYGAGRGPEAMNTCLGTSACPLYWGTAAASCSEGKVTFTGTSTFSYTVAAGELEAQRPVVLGMRRSCSTGGICTHFIVITGGSGEAPTGYTINDPYRYNPLRMTLDAYTAEGWKLDRLIRYNGTPTCADPDGGSIGYGQSRIGRIDPVGDSDGFTYTAAAGDIVEIRLFHSDGTLDPQVELYAPDGNSLGADDDSAGDRNAFLRSTLAFTGVYTIQVQGAADSSGPYQLWLDRAESDDGSGSCGGDCEGERRWIAGGQALTGTIAPADDVDIYYFNGVKDRSMALSMRAITGTLDAYLALYDPAGVRLAVDDDSGGNLNSWLTYRLPADGAYRVLAYSYNHRSTGRYTLRLEAVAAGADNLARGRPVFVSSVEVPGFEGEKAVDGNGATRWSSKYSDPQWIYVDLGQNRRVSQVVLKWQGAYARQFSIHVKVSGGCLTCWQRVYATSSGQGGTNVINFVPVDVRYVLVKGLQRATRWGYSLWEFEVYDTTAAAEEAAGAVVREEKPVPAPLAAPPPPESPPEAQPGSGDQEYTPPADTSPGDETPPAEDGATVLAWIRSPDPDGQYGIYTPWGWIRFTAEAASAGAEGAIPIVAYEWYADVGGLLGREQDFLLPAGALLPGVRTIYLRVQNAAGTWSEEVAAEIEVEWGEGVYLPVVIR